MTISEFIASKKKNFTGVFHLAAGINGEKRKLLSQRSLAKPEIKRRSEKKEAKEIQENGAKPTFPTTKSNTAIASSTDSTISDLVISEPSQAKPEIEPLSEKDEAEEIQENRTKPIFPIPRSITRADSTISDWVISINEKLDELPLRGSCSYPWLTHIIYRVPKNLREIERKSYTPHIVSIGPYHRGRKRLRDMERHKWRILRHLLDRCEQRQLEPFLAAIGELEPRLRNCYSESTDKIDIQEFVEMMLLDGCFVLEVLRASVEGFISYGYTLADPIFTSRGALPCIQRDLLMLENQLPLFLLGLLFELTSEQPKQIQPGTGIVAVSRLALEFFKPVVSGGRTQYSSADLEEGLHLLHVIRKSLLPPPTKNVFGCYSLDKNKNQPQLMMHCVTSLRGAGVKFKKGKSDKFMDVKFENGVLEIPPLVIHDSSKSIFLNLIAFEQCYPHCSNHVSTYVSFMDGLINTSRDVRYLHAKGIVDHGLGNEAEVARLFNMLCREVAFDINDFYLGGVSADVERYYLSRWRGWWAILRHEYFHNPWAILSILAAVLLIGLTLGQTFYTVFPYYVPN